jgi:hypothetical protein
VSSFAIAFSLHLTACCGGSPCGPSEEELARRQQEQAAAAAQQKVAEEERKQQARELKAYASEHLPELARELEALNIEAAERERALQSYGKDLTMLGRKPQSDPEYTKRTKEVAEIRKVIGALERERADAFLAWRAFQHFPDKDATKSKAEHDKLVARAKREAAQARAMLQGLSKSSATGAKEASRLAPPVPPVKSVEVASPTIE